MKKSISILLALLIIMTIALASCKQDDSVGTNSQKTESVDFIKNFFEVSDSGLSFDIENILETAVPEFELNTGNNGFIAYKDGILIKDDEMYFFLEDNGLLVSVKKTLDSDDQTAYETNVAKITELFTNSTPVTDVSFDIDEIFEILDIESLIELKNFEIDGSKYTLKQDVLIKKLRSSFEDIVETYAPDDEKEAAIEETNKYIDNIKTLKLYFTQSSKGKLEAVNFNIVYKDDTTKADGSFKMTFNSKSLVSDLDFEFESVTDKSTTAYDYEAKMTYDSDDNIRTMELKCKTNAPSVMDLDENYMIINSSITITSSMDLTKKNTKNAVIATVSVNTNTTIADEEYTKFAKAFDMSVAEAKELFADIEGKNEEKITVTMDPNAQNAIVSGKFNGETLNYTLKFETEKIAKIPAAIDDARKAAIADYK